MGASKPKVKSVDPSTYEADIQRKKQKMEFKTTQKANQATADSIAYKNQAVKSMNEGLGLLSQYLDGRISSQRKQNKLYDLANTVDIPRLREEAKMGASQLADGFLSGYKGGRLK
jgi:hypothetical protein